MLLIVFVFVTSYAFYLYSTWTFDYWKKKKLPYPPPVPLLGNIKEVVLLKEYNGLCHQRIYRMFPKERFVGMYQLRTPNLLLRDPNLIKQFLIKDFDHFSERGIHTDETREPLTGNLVNLTGRRWKVMRSKLTPVFSSGKIKQMFPLLLACSDQLRDFVESQLGKDADGVLEMRELTARFTTDVIGTIAFGLQFESMAGESIFREMGRKAMKPSAIWALARAMRLFVPWMYDLLKLRTFPDEVNSFFVNVISDTMKRRDESKYERNDFLQILMQIRDNCVNNTDSNIELDEKVIAAQAFVFFVAGFETSSTTLSYCLYELSKNQDCQDKLYKEIQKVLKEHDGLTYESVSDMVFLEQTILETMRLHPPVGFICRMCTKPYKIPDTDVVLDEGVGIIVPVFALHHDPELFPDPESFVPERFANKELQKAPYFLPFGEGPRICIGQRFAMLEMKLALVRLLQYYKFSLSEKTPEKLSIDPKSFIQAPVGGIWLKHTARQ